MLHARPDSSAVVAAPALPPKEARAKTLSSSRAEARAATAPALDAQAVTVHCDASWGSFFAQLDVPAHMNLAAALERFHRRLSVELERVWERNENAGADEALGIAALLMRPERFMRRMRFVVRDGTQSNAPRAAHVAELVTLRIQVSGLGNVGEHGLEPSFLAPLCAALLSSDTRASAEACIVSVLVAMLQEELARGADTRPSVHALSG